MAELFPGILLDIVDDEWLVDKLPHDVFVLVSLLENNLSAGGDGFVEIVA
jgi:hypothetical protein